MHSKDLLSLVASGIIGTLSLATGCGDDDGGGSSSGGASGSGGSTGGASGSGGSTGGASGSGGSTGGASGSGGSTGGASGSGGTDAGTGGSSTGGADSGTGGSDAGPCTAAPDAGAACNTVVNGAAFVQITQVASAVPTGTGGTIADGHYFMTKLEGYTGNQLGSLTMKQTLDMCSNVGQLVNDEKKPTEIRKSFTFSTNGTSITTTTTCTTQSPNVDVPYSSYTATATAFTLYSTALKFSVTYTKQ